MTFSRAFALIGVAIIVLVVNVAASFLYMVVYGHIINPGHESQYYQDHIQIAGPYCSIVAGIPVMFIAGWWVAGWWNQALGYRGALAVWLAYILMDLSILGVAGFSFYIGIFFVVSFATKLAAAYWGASTRLRNIALQGDRNRDPSK